MTIAEKIDYLKVKTVNDNDILAFVDFDKYHADIEYNSNNYSLYGHQIDDKNAIDIVKDLGVKVDSFYRVINKDNKEVYFNEILLSIAELIFRLRIDLGVKK
jgi:hypothetical protein